MKTTVGEWYLIIYKENQIKKQLASKFI